MTSILIADDHALFRDGLSLLLEQNGFSIVGQAADGAEAVRLAALLAPDVTVMDLSMPYMNGIEAGKIIRRGNPRAKLILLTMHEDDVGLLEALRNGFSGCVLKARTARELTHAIAEVASGAFYLGPDIPESVVEALTNNTRLPSQALSARERQVVTMVAEGASNKEISRSLLLSPKTIESHRRRIMQKLSLTQTADLVRFAIRAQLIEA